jgi:hypothetical protein
MKTSELKELIERFGEKYSDILGIDLPSRKDEEIFKWFLASILFGAPITESSVLRTYRCFQKHDVLTPRKILKTGWDGLVKILDEGTYTRYDFKTADKLLAVTKNLMEKYGGSLNLIHTQASDKGNLEDRLKALGKGIGPVTVSIFLRELRDIWKKADPKPTDLEVLGARELEILNTDLTAEETSKELKVFWKKNKIHGRDFVNFETALLRIGKDCRRKMKKR